jgi:hypothetical protein
MEDGMVYRLAAFIKDIKDLKLLRAIPHFIRNILLNVVNTPLSMVTGLTAQQAKKIVGFRSITGFLANENLIFLRNLLLERGRENDSNNLLIKRVDMDTTAVDESEVVKELSATGEVIAANHGDLSKSCKALELLKKGASKALRFVCKFLLSILAIVLNCLKAGLMTVEGVAFCLAAFVKDLKDLKGLKKLIAIPYLIGNILHNVILLPAIEVVHGWRRPVKDIMSFRLSGEGVCSDLKKTRTAKGFLLSLKALQNRWCDLFGLKFNYREMIVRNMAHYIMSDQRKGDILEVTEDALRKASDYLKKIEEELPLEDISCFLAAQHDEVGAKFIKNLYMMKYITIPRCGGRVSSPPKT